MHTYTYKSAPFPIFITFVPRKLLSLNLVEDGLFCFISAEAKGHPKSQVSWFHRKPTTALKIVAIVVPVVCLILVGLGVSLWYFITRGMLRCPIYFSRRGGRSRVPMQPLVNAEI